MICRIGSPIKKAYEKNIFFTSYPTEYNMRRPCPLGAVGRAHWLAVRPAGRGGNGARPAARPGCPAAPAAGGCGAFLLGWHTCYYHRGRTGGLPSCASAGCGTRGDALSPELWHKTGGIRFGIHICRLSPLPLAKDVPGACGRIL